MRKWTLETRKRGARKWHFVVASYNWEGLSEVMDGCYGETEYELGVGHTHEYQIVGLCEHCNMQQTRAHIELFEGKK